MVFLVEGLLTCSANLLSIAVFWRRRRSLKRTSYVLINLSGADLGLGFCTIVYAIAVVPWPGIRGDHLWRMPFVFFVFASLYSLTLVAMDTAYAIVLPLRHRTTSRCAYRFAFALTWLLPVLACIPWLLSDLDVSLPFEVSASFAVVTSALCLILIALSYSLVFYAVSKRSTRRTREQNQRKKLVSTLFLVTVLSLVTWIPGQLSFISHFVPQLKPTRYFLRTFLMLNSFLNPIVYTFRLPEFRSEIKIIISCLFRV